MLTTSAVLTAAGSGERFGHKKGKLFVPFLKETIFHQALAGLRKIQLKEIVIVSNATHVATIEDIVVRQDHAVPIRVLEGGKTRQDSVRNGVLALGATDRVLIHDAARPNLKDALLQRLLRASQKHKAVIPVLPIADTIKRVDGDRVIETIDRQQIVHVQTPQIFDIDLLKRAYETLDTAVTDEAALIESLGEPVHTVDGDIANIKITYPKDLAIAEVLALS